MHTYMSIREFMRQDTFDVLKNREQKHIPIHSTPQNKNTLYNTKSKIKN